MALLPGLLCVCNTKGQCFGNVTTQYNLRQGGFKFTEQCKGGFSPLSYGSRYRQAGKGCV